MEHATEKMRALPDRIHRYKLSKEVFLGLFKASVDCPKELYYVTPFSTYRKVRRKSLGFTVGYVFYRIYNAKIVETKRRKFRMVVVAKGFSKTGNTATRRLLTYEEFVESYKQYKAEKARLIAQAK